MLRIVIPAATIQTTSKGKIPSLALKFRPMFTQAAVVLESSEVVPPEAPPKILTKR
jgi:hypothetical protein